MNDGDCGCSGGAPGCGGANRREFLQVVGLGAAAAATAHWLTGPVMAGPFDAGEFEKLVPADKKLSAEWAKALFARGGRTIYRGAELEKIGMPIGGICAGQLHRGGDGKLWHWDLFNQHIGTGDSHYAKPPSPASPLEQGFAIQITTGDKTQTRPLTRAGWSDISFIGEYPIAYVEYRDPEAPVTVALEAFSPFVPLNPEDSALPATVLRFTVKNTSNAVVEAEIAGWLENAVCLHSATTRTGLRRNRIARRDGLVLLECSAEALPPDQRGAKRPDITFEDFEKGTYDGWTVTGTAFGDGPIEKAKMPAYQGDVGSQGRFLVNSHNTRHGEDVTKGDAHTGTLTSKAFAIQRSYITFLIGGGAHPGKTCINLLIDDKVALSATGRNDNRMGPCSWDVRRWAGQTARLQIVDNETGPWGNISIDDIVFSDEPRGGLGPLEGQPDFGTLALALLDGRAEDRGVAALPRGGVPEGVFSKAAAAEPDATAPFEQRLLGALSRKLTLEAGQSATVTFAITWCFPNLALKDGGRFYATRFGSAGAVTTYLAKEFDRLSSQTRLWHDTWYDSTLPFWFLDRTFLNTSILATSTAHWFKTGRFYGWEGVGCCEGTCTHVWHYAHAVGRLFPQLERDLRRRTDFGTALNPTTGVIQHRGEGAGLAVDGQAGCILRAYREHQMSADGAFLKELWPKIKLAMQCLMKMDKGEGLIEGAQHNTLDQPWFGKIAWLSSLYLAALRACEEMAKEVGDADFAAQCRAVFERGGKALDAQLFNGEYYVHIPDQDHIKSVGSHNGCEVDQVFGQSWAWQVNLGRILPEAHVKQALAALWRYNFTLDVGPYRAAHKPGRWYAMAGEGGLLMCTWPRGEGARVGKDYDYYLNECMNGFEYQAAGHMIWEGLVQEGLAVTRAIHDRYHASRRNPWNEVECGDHYARSMASYGVYLAACGFEYHGPRGHIGFAPRLTPEDFKAAFTTAEGWGTFTQKRGAGGQQAMLELRWGKLRLRTLALTLAEGMQARTVRVTLDGKAVATTHTQEKTRVVVALAEDATVTVGQKVKVEMA